MHTLSAEEARRVAVHAQLLDAYRPADLDEVLDRLTLVQHDPTNAVAPSADLVLWSRLGTGYSPTDLRDALDEQRVISLQGLLRPASDLALFTAEMSAWPGPDAARWQLAQDAWVEANDVARRDVLDALRSDGPLPQDELPDTCEVPWRSSGWNAGRNLTMLLSLLVERGEVAVAGGWGKERRWDLAERVYPDDEPVPVEEARRERDRRRLAALGIARAKAARQPGEPFDVGEAGEAAEVEGVRGRWRVDPDALAAVTGGTADLGSRVALLSPLDRLHVDRLRMAELFGFDYQLEMYKPAAQRRWGYFALPVLAGDRLVGKLDATADREAGVLHVHAVHEDEPWDADTRVAVAAETRALADWLGLVEERD